jgi:hypothetical protein
MKHDVTHVMNVDVRPASAATDISGQRTDTFKALISLSESSRKKAGIFLWKPNFRGDTAGSW